MFNDMCIDYSVLQVAIRSSIYNGSIHCPPTIIQVQIKVDEIQSNTHKSNSNTILHFFLRVDK